MLYQTHHHPLFLPSSSKLLTSPSLSPSSSTTTTNSSSQVEKEMECMMKGASLKPEMMVGFGPKHVSYDDFTTNFNSQIGGSVPGEDFFVDQLLNLTNEDSTEQVLEEEEQQKYDDGSGFLVVEDEPLEEKKQVPPNCNKVPTFVSPPLETERNKDDFGSVLSIPAEEADLEWLSHFVEDSFSQFSAPYPATVGPLPVSEKPKPEPVSGVYKAPCFTPPPSKSRRSKRARTGGRVWSMSLADTSSISSPSSPSTTTTTTTTRSSSPSSPNPDTAPPKKHRKREGGPGGGPPRRCSHCGVQKTPQWRTGPMGAKTLCNACGVRYKSGRLLPEYRPACSPTFSSELHSNNHRKVLEMRRKKEVTMSGRPEPNLAHPVPSFG